MPYDAVAIVGRPNVGKSTLFNALVGRRLSIEAPTSGVTRDRVLHPMTVEGKTFDLIDTGGIGVVDSQRLEADVERQIDLAIEAATALVFLVDARDGLTPHDEEVADRLRRVGKPVLLAANKVDTPNLDDMVPSFHALGFGDVMPVSAKHRRHIDDLKEAIAGMLPRHPKEEEEAEASPLLKIAFVGKRNVGKSSLINQLVGAERAIVSDLPGTTRDALDVVVERDGRKFIAIDTAGLRKRGQMDDIMEFFGQIRSERTVRRADAVILMLDASTDISKVDKRLGSLVLEEFKPCVIALNKWDLAREQNPKITVEDYLEYLKEKLTGLWFCPVAALSAKTGENAWGLIDKAIDLAAVARREVGTGELNRAIAEAQKKRRPKPSGGKVGKMYYATQIGSAPPNFLVFCNNPALFDDNYKRFLANHFRKHLGYDEVPVRFVFRARRKDD